MGRNKDKNSRRSRAERRRLAKALTRRTVEQFPDLGANGYAQRRQDRFRPFCGPSSIGHEMTCAGRLMLVGAFDGHEAKPDAILDALQRYDRGYWRNYSDPAPRVSDQEREVRGTGSGGKGEILPDPHGEWFDAIDAVLRSAGHQIRMAVHSITVDLHWFPDDDAPWASRIINTRITQKRAEMLTAKQEIPAALCVAGELAFDSDWAMLELLIQGAEILSRGKKSAEQSDAPMRSAA